MNTIKLTDSAKGYLVQITKKENKPYVSLAIKGGGCSGFQYVWGLSADYPDVTWSDPIDDCLVVDPMAELMLFGCTIDYVTELGGSFLKVINPNATASCGCGESFSV